MQIFLTIILIWLLIGFAATLWGIKRGNYDLTAFLKNNWRYALIFSCFGPLLIALLIWEK